MELNWMRIELQHVKWAFWRHRMTICHSNYFRLSWWIQWTLHVSPKTYDNNKKKDNRNHNKKPNDNCCSLRKFQLDKCSLGYRANTNTHRKNNTIDYIRWYNVISHKDSYQPNFTRSSLFFFESPEYQLSFIRNQRPHWNHFNHF